MVGQAVVGLVEDVEELRADLERFGFLDAEVLDGRKIPLGEARALHHVAAFVTEPLRLAVGLKLLESGGVEPFRGGARTVVWIPEQVGAVAGEAGNFRGSALQRDIA